MKLKPFPIVISETQQPKIFISRYENRSLEFIQRHLEQILIGIEFPLIVLSNDELNCIRDSEFLVIGLTTVLLRLEGDRREVQIYMEQHHFG